MALIDSDQGQSGMANPAQQHDWLHELLPSLSAQETGALTRSLGPVTTDAEAWCREHPFISPRSVLPVSIVVIVQHPDLPPEGISPVVRAILWITAIDDLFDKKTLSEHELSTVTAQCLGVACTPDSSPSSPYAACLREIRDELATRATWPWFRAAWAAALAQVFDGSMYEYWMNRRFSGQAAIPTLPTYDEYFAFSRLSIGLSFLWLTDIIAEDKPELLQHLSDLLAFAGECGRALRLTNDLATHQRERGESTLNSVFLMAVQLRQDDPALTWPQAEAQAVASVERARAAAMKHARDMAGALVTPSDMHKRLLRGLELGTELYALRDVREWAAEPSDPKLGLVPPRGDRW